MLSFILDTNISPIYILKEKEKKIPFLNLQYINTKCVVYLLCDPAN